MLTYRRSIADWPSGDLVRLWRANKLIFHLVSSASSLRPWGLANRQIHCLPRGPLRSDDRKLIKRSFDFCGNVNQLICHLSGMSYTIACGREMWEILFIWPVLAQCSHCIFMAAFMELQLLPNHQLIPLAHKNSWLQLATWHRYRHRHWHGILLSARTWTTRNQVRRIPMQTQKRLSLTSRQWEVLESIDCTQKNNGASMSKRHFQIIINVKSKYNLK